MTNRIWKTLLALAVATAWITGASAQQPQEGVELSADTLEYGDKDGQVLLNGNVVIKYQGSVLTCQRADYNRNSGIMIATGNAMLVKDGKQLNADRMTYNSRNEQASAAGNVVYNDSEREWTGPELAYNFQTGEGSFGDLEVYYEPFHIISPKTKKAGEGHFVAENAVITTCDPNDKEFYITAKRADIYSERIIQAESVKFYLNDIPVMYLPSYTVDLDREHTNFDVLPGYGSRPGAFILTGYSWFLNESVYTTTHLDYRSKRGLGIGQDLRWRDTEETLWRGLATVYFAQDDEPYKSEDQEERQRAQGINIDEERYRVRVNHTQALSDYENLFVELNYMSDPEVTKDFFDEEYRLSPDPENRISYIYTDRYFQGGIEVKKELNDEDFSSVNRIPEGSFDVSRIQVADSPFYYESESAAAFLEQTFSDFDRATLGDIDDFESLRLHSSHRILYPNRIAGWLNVIPRVGATGTYYGDTPGQQVNTTNLVSSVDADGVVSISTNTATSFVGGGAEFRGLFELGGEASFKAFKVLDEDGVTPLGWGRGLRHVVEPFLDYTYVPEPDVEPTQLFQFDEIDQLGRRNDVRVGIRNKFQTRVDTPLYGAQEEKQTYANLVDLIDAQVSTVYRLDPEPFEEELGPWDIDVEIRPTVNVSLDVIAQYDHNESELLFSSTQLSYYFPNGGRVALDHLYFLDLNNVVQAEYELFPQSRIGIEGYTRFEIEDSILEEQMILATYKTDCVGYGMGFRWIEGDEDPNSLGRDSDDWRVWFQIWLLAFPKSILNMGGN